jgi:hypothetical protein
MHEEDDEIPWCARVLERPPIDIEAMPDADLETELAERLTALLEAYRCEATPEGWRTLAIKLALEHERGLKIITPVDRKPRQGGRETETESWTHLLMLNQERKKCRTNAEAAKAVHKMLGGKRRGAPSIRRLQNILSEAKSGRFRHPRWMQRWTWEWRIDDAIAKVVDRIPAAKNP